MRVGSTHIQPRFPIHPSERCDFSALMQRDANTGRTMPRTICTLFIRKIPVNPSMCFFLAVSIMELMSRN
jgi:hypothetical protein